MKSYPILIAILLSGLSLISRGRESLSHDEFRDLVTNSPDKAKTVANDAFSSEKTDTIKAYFEAEGRTDGIIAQMLGDLPPSVFKNQTVIAVLRAKWPNDNQGLSSDRDFPKMELACISAIKGYLPEEISEKDIGRFSDSVWRVKIADEFQREAGINPQPKINVDNNGRWDAIPSSQVSRRESQEIRNPKFFTEGYWWIVLYGGIAAMLGVSWALFRNKRK